MAMFNWHTYIVQLVCNSKAENMASKMSHNKHRYETCPDRVIMQNMTMQEVADLKKTFNQTNCCFSPQYQPDWAWACHNRVWAQSLWWGPEDWPDKSWQSDRRHVHKHLFEELQADLWNSWPVSRGHSRGIHKDLVLWSSALPAP